MPEADVCEKPVCALQVMPCLPDCPSCRSGELCLTNDPVGVWIHVALLSLVMHENLHKTDPQSLFKKAVAALHRHVTLQSLLSDLAVPCRTCQALWPRLWVPVQLQLTVAV